MRKTAVALVTSALMLGGMAVPSGATPARPWMDRSEGPGDDVVQAYVTAPASAGEPPRQLRGFAKVTLRPGQTKHVVLTLDPHSFSSWDTGAGRWTTVPGRYTVSVGDSSRDLPLHQSVTVRR